MFIKKILYGLILPFIFNSLVHSSTKEDREINDFEQKKLIKYTPDVFSENPFRFLPKEVKGEIFKYLDIKNYLKAQSVCKSWQQILNDEKRPFGKEARILRQCAQKVTAWDIKLKYPEPITIFEIADFYHGLRRIFGSLSKEERERLSQRFKEKYKSWEFFHPSQSSIPGYENFIWAPSYKEKFRFLIPNVINKLEETPFYYSDKQYKSYDDFWQEASGVNKRFISNNPCSLTTDNFISFNYTKLKEDPARRYLAKHIIRALSFFSCLNESESVYKILTNAQKYKLLFQEEKILFDKIEVIFNFLDEKSKVLKKTELTLKMIPILEKEISNRAENFYKLNQFQELAVCYNNPYFDSIGKSKFKHEYEFYGWGVYCNLYGQNKGKAKDYLVKFLEKTPIDQAISFPNEVLVWFKNALEPQTDKLLSDKLDVLIEQRHQK